MKIFAKIRFYYAVAVIAPVVSMMILLIYLFPKHKGVIIHRLNALILKLLGTHVEVIGHPDKDAQLFLINHQGLLDIIALEAMTDRHYRWVAKKELFEIPWFGRLLQQGEMISVDREDRKGLIKLMKDVKESLEKMHRPIAIFPEGTRSKDGKVLPFKEGAKFIAEKFGLIVQPVVIVGTKRVLNEHRRTAEGGDMKIIFLPSVDVSQAPETWFSNIRESMQKTLDETAKSATTGSAS